MEKINRRDEIIRIGTQLIACHGFNATGIDAILRESGVVRGSFYHFFKSKEEFGLAVIDTFAERFEKRLSRFLDDEAVPPLERLRNFLDDAQERLVRHECCKGCLIGNLGQELADQNERFRIRLDEVFSFWKGRFSAIISKAQANGDISHRHDPEVFGEFILSGLEGAVLRCKVTRSPRPFENFTAILFDQLLACGSRK